jgi:hypothetical protein
MGQIDTNRIENLEEETTLINFRLNDAIKELDARITGADCYIDITRSSDIITQIDYYSDIARTQLRMRRTFSRTTGADNVDYITGIITTFYNSDGSTDSTVTSTILRTDDKITGCDNVFNTSESIC